MISLQAERRAVLTEIEDTDIALDRIKSQIAHVTARQQTTGEYADAHWWARVNGAQRHYGHKRQRLQERLGELNREIRASNARTSDKRLISCLRTCFEARYGEAAWATLFDEAVALSRDD